MYSVRWYDAVYYYIITYVYLLLSISRAVIYTAGGIRGQSPVGVVGMKSTETEQIRLPVEINVEFNETKICNYCRFRISVE